MADRPHIYSKLHDAFSKDFDYGYPDQKTWAHSPAQLEYYKENKDKLFDGFFHERVPIDKLYKDNNLDELSDWDTQYGPNNEFKYDENKDKELGVNGIIRAILKPDGRLHIDNGRHRIKALKNAGYTHATIPIFDERIGQDDIFSVDYKNAGLNDANKLKKQIKYFYDKDSYNYYKSRLDNKLWWMKYLHGKGLY